MKKTNSLRNQLYKTAWLVTWTVLVRPFPRQVARRWEIFLLRLFGAKIGKKCRVYSSAKIHIPYNLVMKDRSTIADKVHIQNTAIITIGERTMISQGSYLCAGTHDITRKSLII